MNTCFGLAWPPFHQLRFVPTSMAALAGSLRAAGFKYKVFDLNANLFSKIRAGNGAALRDWGGTNALEALLSVLLFGGRAPELSVQLASSLDASVRDIVISAFESTAASIAGECCGLGISVTNHGFLGAALLSATVKKQRPDIPIVWGGPILPPSVARGLLSAFPQVDAIAWGDGEEQIVEIAGKTAAGKELANIDGLSYRAGSGILVSENKACVRDYGNIPDPDFSWANPSDYRELHLSLSVNRGCSWNRCNFCSERLIHGDLRVRSPRSIADAYRTAVQTLHPALVNIDDVTANINEGFILELAETLNGISNVPWTVSARTNGFTDKIARALSAAGCKVVFFGIESFSDRVLSLMNKGCTKADNLRALHSCIDAGMYAAFSLIAGFPGEQITDIEETGNILKAENIFNPRTSGTVAWFRPLLGAPMHCDPDRFGIEFDRKGREHRFLPPEVAEKVVSWEPFWRSKTDTRDIRKRWMALIATIPELAGGFDPDETSTEQPPFSSL